MITMVSNDKKLYIFLVFYDNLTFDTFCGSFDCVLTHVESDSQCKS
jgi:hypothetical protein